MESAPPDGDVRFFQGLAGHGKEVAMKQDINRKNVNRRGRGAGCDLSEEHPSAYGLWI